MPENEQTQMMKSNPMLSKSTPLPQPLIDLQIYPDTTKKPSNPLADKQQAMLPIQPFALSSPFMPPQFQNYFNNSCINLAKPLLALSLITVKFRTRLTGTSAGSRINPARQGH